MSTPLEQARAIAQARHFLSELCVPGKIKRVPSEVRREARNRLKHMPMSWILKASSPSPVQLSEMWKIEDHYRREFWKGVYTK
jgi:hypothetical protein